MTIKNLFNFNKFKINLNSFKLGTLKDIKVLYILIKDLKYDLNITFKMFSYHNLCME